MNRETGVNQKPITSAEARERGYDRDVIAGLELEEEGRQKALLLIEDIRVAFSGVPRPRITLSVARGYDEEWVLSDERVLELSCRDPEQCWEDVTDESMRSCQEYFCFADEEGWRFYLPAFMCHDLRDFPNHGGGAAHYACEAGRGLGLLTDQQMACVIRFAELCSQYKAQT